MTFFPLISPNDIFSFDLAKWYFQYHRTDLDTENL
jgi:hypothetical protein